MKKFLSVALMLAVICVVGCGSNYSDETFLEERTFWVANKEDIDDFIDGAGRGDKGEFDEDFLQQQLLEGRIQFSDKEVKVAVTDELKGGKVVEIKFLQGRYKNKVGYVFPEFIIDVGKEKEIKKKQNEERRAKEAKQLEEQAKREQKEKARLEELTAEGGDGVQIVVMLGDGTSAYQKLLGKTNLPEGTYLSVTLAGVKKEMTVQNDGTFSALFERAIVPVGGQNVSITTLDGEQIYSGTIQVQ